MEVAKTCSSLLWDISATASQTRKNVGQDLICPSGIDRIAG